MFFASVPFCGTQQKGIKSIFKLQVSETTSIRNKKHRLKANDITIEEAVGAILYFAIYTFTLIYYFLYIYPQRIRKHDYQNT